MRAPSAPAASGRSLSPSSPTRWSSTRHAAWRPIRCSSATAATCIVAGAARRRRPPGPRSSSAWWPAPCASSAGLLLPDPVGPVFVALGVGLPGLALQDSWRFAFFAHGRGSSAFVNDLFWTVLLVLALVALDSRGDGSAARCLLAFGGTATLAAVLGAVQARRPPTPDPCCGVAADPPPTVRSVPRRERQHQRRIAAALLRARRRGRPRGGRLRAGLRDPDGPVPRRSHGDQPGCCPRSLAGIPPGLRAPRALLFRARGCSGGGSRCLGVDPADRLSARSWASPPQGALDADCTVTFLRSLSRSPQPRSPPPPPRDCAPWVWPAAASERS